jgi:hypothetical protein
MFDLISKVVSPIIDKIFPDKKQADEAKLKLFEMQQSGEIALFENRAKVLVAEATSDSWLTKSWRPITMLCFVFLIMNRYFITPFVNAVFGLNLPDLDIPADMWHLMDFGLGGYIVGRSGVQMIQAWKGPHLPEPGATR